MNVFKFCIDCIRDVKFGLVLDLRWDLDYWCVILFIFVVLLIFAVFILWRILKD